MSIIDGIVIKFASKWAGSKLGQLLDGRKAYLAGLGFLAQGLMRISNEQYAEGIEAIIEGIAVMSLRAAVAKGR